MAGCELFLIVSRARSELLDRLLYRSCITLACRDLVEESFVFWIALGQRRAFIRRRLHIRRLARQWSEQISGAGIHILPITLWVEHEWVGIGSARHSACKVVVGIV